jgi:ArsR family transcriptional regulator
MSTERRNFDPIVEEVAKSSAAFGHPLRIAIYRYILDCNARLIKVRNKDIVTKFGYSQSTISEHMNKLAIGGLITTKQDKTSTLYYANAGFVNEYIKNLNTLAKLFVE